MPNPFDAIFNRRRETSGMPKELIEMLLSGTSTDTSDMPEEVQKILEAVETDHKKDCIIHFSRTLVKEGEHTGEIQQTVQIEGTGRQLLNCLTYIMSELLKKGIPVDAIARCATIAQVTALITGDEHEECPKS